MATTNCERKCTNCAPADCPEPPEPVQPPCGKINVANGAYTNATVTVEEGCIINVQEGDPFVYTPDSCCATPGSGGTGGRGPQGPPGSPGQAATISIGQVNTLAPESPATVTNSGSSTNAVFNFGIPKGDKGDPGDSVSGVTVSSANIVIENGVVKSVPVLWPPVLNLTYNLQGDFPRVFITYDKQDNGTVVAVINGLSAWDTELRSVITQGDAQLQAQITALQEVVAGLQQTVDDLTVRLNACCP